MIVCVVQWHVIVIRFSVHVYRSRSLIQLRAGKFRAELISGLLYI